MWSRLLRWWQRITHPDRPFDPDSAMEFRSEVLVTVVRGGKTIKQKRLR